MSRVVRALSLMSGLAIVLVPACSGNGDSLGWYQPDSAIITADASPDDTGVHISRPDVGTGTHSGYGAPEASTQDVWHASQTDTGTPDTGSGSGTGSGDVMTCPATCSTDTQCQESCPAAPAGSQNCCDTATWACFQSVTSTCPGTVHPHDSGSDVY